MAKVLKAMALPATPIPQDTLNQGSIRVNRGCDSSQEADHMFLTSNKEPKGVVARIKDTGYFEYIAPGRN
jgi:hypothetical protein